MGPGGFFPTNPDLVDILGRTDLDFENFYFSFWKNLTSAKSLTYFCYSTGLGPLLLSTLGGDVCMDHPRLALKPIQDFGGKHRAHRGG